MNFDSLMEKYGEAFKLYDEAFKPYADAIKKVYGVEEPFHVEMSRLLFARAVPGFGHILHRSKYSAANDSFIVTTQKAEDAQFIRKHVADLLALDIAVAKEAKP